MADGNKMIINELPVLTYNFLRVNRAELESINGPGSDSGVLPGTDIPGVNVRTDVSRDEIEERVKSVRERLISMDKDPLNVAPNGDVSSRHEKQLIRTGMGLETDELMDRENIPFVLIETEPGADVKEPFFIRNRAGADEECRVLTRRLIHVRKNSRLNVVWECGGEGLRTFGAQTLMLVEEGAELLFSGVQMCGHDTLFMDDIGAVCLGGGSIVITGLYLGGKRVYSGCRIDLAEDGASSDTHIGLLANNGRTYDQNYVAVQRGRDTVSHMNLSAVLSDNAGKIFRGTIDFRQGSSGSSGDEQEDVLLFTDDVENRSMPVILCQEEDVEGRHGATIGDLSEDMLFYMESRGIEREEARRIITRARLLAVARLLPDKALTVQAEQFIRESLY